LRLRTWAYANNWPSSSTIASVPSCARATASSGSGFLGAGPTGDPCLRLSSQKQSSDGIARDSSSIGDGNLAAVNPDARLSNPKFVS
jgi:hypothetical protein